MSNFHAVGSSWPHLGLTTPRWAESRNKRNCTRLPQLTLIEIESFTQQLWTLAVKGHGRKLSTERARSFPLLHRVRMARLLVDKEPNAKLRELVRPRTPKPSCRTRVSARIWRDMVVVRRAHQGLFRCSVAIVPIHRRAAAPWVK